MLDSVKLEDVMTKAEQNAWHAFRMVAQCFWGNNKNENYKELIRILMERYHVLGCRLLMKMHYLNSRIDFFRPNLGDLSEEHGECFHQDISNMERRYQGRWDFAMIGDYVWGVSLCRGVEKT